MVCRANWGDDDDDDDDVKAMIVIRLSSIISSILFMTIR